MRQAIRQVVAGFLLVPLLGGCQPTEKPNTSLVLAGSRSMTPLMTDIAQRFESIHGEIRINVETVPPDRAISDTRQGLADLGMLARTLRPEETGLRAFPIARDGLAFIVHRGNPIQALTPDQIVGLFTGGYVNWKEVGGSDRPIMLAGQGEGRSARDVFLDHFGLRAAQIRADPAVASNEQAIEAVATHPFAIAYASLGLATKASASQPIRLLPLGGVPATLDNVRNGRYLLVRPLQLLLREAPRGVVRDFIDFTRSAEVHDLISKHGFAPMTP